MRDFLNHPAGFISVWLTVTSGFAPMRRSVRFLMHTHTHSPFGRAMFAALESARVNDKFQDPLYVFLELVRAGVMHGNLWSSRAYSGGPSFGIGK